MVSLQKKKKDKKKRKRLFFLGITSLVIIIGTTYTIGKYWVEIYDKYKEKKELKEKLVSLKEKQDELQVDADKLQDGLSSIQKAVDLFGGLLVKDKGTSTKSDYLPRPVYKRFDD